MDKVRTAGQASIAVAALSAAVAAYFLWTRSGRWKPRGADAGAPSGTAAPLASGYPGDSGLLSAKLCPPMNSVPPPSPGSLHVAAGGSRLHLSLVEERVKADCLAPETRALGIATRQLRIDANLPVPAALPSYLAIENREPHAVQFDVQPSEASGPYFCEPSEALVRPGERFVFWCSRKKGGAEHFEATPITAWRVVRLQVNHLLLQPRSPGFTCEKPFTIRGRLRNDEPVSVEHPEVAVSLVAPSGELAAVVLATQLPNEIGAGHEVAFVAEGSACGPVRISRAVAVGRVSR